ncbi:SDR family oxidoreductase [Herbiconiux sp. CPCC 203407]|uniref:SDR family oxidoreductase n=1 Tax=Herbiconiux oxytropis TaxID=2970915 RepID=A0AA41XFP1_9MICO|nr:SDR family NAD(P)-dependent oxidoreductase [Herbiconiux oxytropis]MCS5721833.1 SDR family oxidoreductase [Herbiconiux oxytropis]MCS5727359.1 SDR family oxidoreductase [Herbiconiux oxytropis]
MFVLDGKVALVTGAGQNVGAGIARTLAAQGATVIVNDFHLDRAERTVAAIVEAGGEARALRFDVSDFAAVGEAVADIASTEGPVDILVNNAGTGGPERLMPMEPFAATSPDDWATILAPNLYGVLNCSRAVLGGMIQRQHGRIITVSSSAGQEGLPIGIASYSAAKAGQIGFMRSIAAENAKYGITCNTISLGLVLEDASALQHYADAIPLGRVGKPEDPAYLAVYLSSDEADWITGQTIGVNGGSLMI